MKHVRTILAAICLSTCPSFCALARAQESSAPAVASPLPFRPDGARWSIAIPTGWALASDATLAQLNDEARAHGLQLPYIAMLVTDPPTASYALVQAADGLKPGASAETIRTGVGAGMQRGMNAAREGLAAEFKDFNNTEPTFDAGRAELRVQGAMTQADGSVLAMITIGHFGFDATVFIHCYAPGSEFDSMRPRFEALNSAFAFDAGRQYTVGPADGKETQTQATPGATDWARVATRAAVGALIGACVVGVAWLLRRSKSK